jgi:hypothetical protein
MTFKIRATSAPEVYGMPIAQAFDLPAMDLPTALTIRMIEQFIPTLLPPAIRKLLELQFARARSTLNDNPDSPFSQRVTAIDGLKMLSNLRLQIFLAQPGLIMRSTIGNSSWKIT